MKSLKVQLAILAVLVAALGGAVFKGTAILDWARLRGYTPPAAIVGMADQTTMTSKARHLFYLNRPEIADKTTFNQACKGNQEQTIILGCYHGGQNGIYVYDITDTRLEGVEQVTAAHETLHAAYERLSSADRAAVDTQLQDYYDNDLNDERVKKVIDSYRKTEPNDLLNEMHSIFGTEVADLPSGLETYYRRYFTNRKAVTDLAAEYQSEFTSRQDAVAAADAKLAALKSEIDDTESKVASQRSALAVQKQTLDDNRASGNVSAYNSGVPAYNAAVARYNSSIQSLRDKINQYNSLVAERNSIALEENELIEAISSNSIPATQ